MPVLLTLLAAQLSLAAPDPVTDVTEPALVKAVGQGWADGLAAPVCQNVGRPEIEFALQQQFAACSGFTGCLVAAAKRVPATKVLFGSVRREGRHGVWLTVTLIDTETRQAETIASTSSGGAVAVRRMLKRAVERACEELQPEAKKAPAAVAQQDLSLDLPMAAPETPRNTELPVVPPADTEPTPVATTLPPAAVSPPPAPIHIWPRSPAAQGWTIASLVVAGGATIVGGGLGGGVLSAAAQRDNAATPSQFYAAQSSAAGRGIGADVSFGVGALAAVAAVVFWVKGDAIFGPPSSVNAGAGGGL